MPRCSRGHRRLWGLLGALAALCLLAGCGRRREPASTDALPEPVGVDAFAGAVLTERFGAGQVLERWTFGTDRTVRMESSVEYDCAAWEGERLYGYSYDARTHTLYLALRGVEGEAGFVPEAQLADRLARAALAPYPEPTPEYRELLLQNVARSLAAVERYHCAFSGGTCALSPEYAGLFSWNAAPFLHTDAGFVFQLPSGAGGGRRGFVTAASDERFTVAFMEAGVVRERVEFAWSVHSEKDALVLTIRSPELDERRFQFNGEPRTFSYYR